MKRKIWIIPLLIVVLLSGAFFLYTGIYYHADSTASEALVSDQTVSVTKTDFGWYFDGPSQEDALIFYPGGKVEETAYAPFLKLLAEQGMDVFLVRMPFRLAVFGKNRADRVLDSYEYDRWFIGGHSLGGAMAALYAAEHEEPAGVVLCAAYPTKQLERSDLELVLYGSEDEVLNREKLNEGLQFSSDYLMEYEIRGGNHAQFGCYGIQSGDGAAWISSEDQQKQAADFILQNLQR